MKTYIEEENISDEISAKCIYSKTKWTTKQKKEQHEQKHITRKSDSSYYLYASTDSKQAEQYKPQKVRGYNNR